MEFSCQEGDGARHEHDRGEGGTRWEKSSGTEEYMPTLLQNGPRCDGRWGVASLVRITVVEFPVTESVWVQSAMWETIPFQEWKYQLSGQATYYGQWYCGVPKHLHSACPESTSTTSIWTCWLKTPHPLHPSPARTWTWSIVWISLISSSHPILFICLQEVRELCQLFEYLSYHHPIPSSSSVSSPYVNLVNFLNISHLIIPSSSSVSSSYVNLVNCLNISHLIIPSHPLHPSLDSTWTWSIVWTSLIWSSHPILVIHLQRVCELCQLFEYLSSDHTIPSSSSVSRKYVNLVNCLDISHLIIPSHPLHPSLESMWTLSIVWISHPIPSSSSVSREYVNLVNCLNISHLIIPSHPLHLSPGSTWTWANCLDISHLIIPSYPLHPSLARTWTWSIFWISLIWSSHPIIFICLQYVCEIGQLIEYLSSDHPIPSSSSVSRMYVNLVNCLNISHLIILSHPLHPSPVCTWTWSNVWISLIWSSHPILFIRL